MPHIDYQALRGKIHAYAPAQPSSNPHLWVIVEADGQLYFATINIRSNQDLPGDAIGKSYLHYLIDNDFDHPIVPSILGRPPGFSPVERNYGGGALDFQRGNLFDPTKMRVLPAQGPGEDGLAQRIGAILQVAQLQNSDVIFYGNAFVKDNAHQTDAAFGFTPTTPLGLDNIHMAQGDPREVNLRLHENAIWHDGAAFFWDERAHAMTAIFLAFQSQSWHSNAMGDYLYGVTGCEAPTYDYSGPDPRLIPPPPRAAEIILAHRSPDGPGSVVVANTGMETLDLAGWRLLVDAEISFPLPSRTLAPGEPVSLPLPNGALADRGGLLTLLNAINLKVDGVSYIGGDGTKGWATSFA